MSVNILCHLNDATMHLPIWTLIWYFCTVCVNNKTNHATKHIFPIKPLYPRALWADRRVDIRIINAIFPQYPSDPYPSELSKDGETAWEDCMKVESWKVVLPKRKSSRKSCKPETAEEENSRKVMPTRWIQMKVCQCLVFLQSRLATLSFPYFFRRHIQQLESRRLSKCQRSRNSR